jgi:hypothetical protein
MRIFYKLLFATLLTTCLACAHNQIISLETNQIANGIQTGAPALPYFIYSKISLPDLNEEFKNSNTLITLEDTYDAAYQFSFKDIPANGNTDQAFDNMETASQYLQSILKSKGVSHYKKYFMTALGTASDDGYILITTIYRPDNTINVFNKFDFLFRQTLTPKDMDFYRAYRANVSGESQDIVYDWAALPTECVSQQAYQAILLTLTANKILAQNRDNDYWRKERQWIAGNHLAVLVKQDMKVSQALGIEKGFTRRQEIYMQ